MSMQILGDLAPVPAPPRPGSPAPDDRPATGVPRPHTRPPLVIVQVRREHLRQARYVACAYAANELAMRQAILLLAQRFHQNGRVFPLRRPAGMRQWSMPATEDYALALEAVFAGVDWVEVQWLEERSDG